MMGWWLLLASPSLVYLMLLGVDVVREGYIIFGKLDYLVLFVAVLYLVSIPILVTHRRRAIGALVVLTSTLVSVAIAEGVASRWIVTPVVDSFPWPPMRRIHHTVSLAGVQSPAVFSVNRFGLRGPSVDSFDSRYSILCVGGSTTECLYITDERSWPWQLGTRLSKRTTAPVFVGNAGRSGHLVKHHQFLIEHYPRTTSFAWIVVLAGINDLGSMLHQNRAQREANVSNDTLFHWTRPHEASYRRLAIWRSMETTLNVGTPIASGRILQDSAGQWVRARQEERARKRRENPLNEAPIHWERDLDIYRQRLTDLVGAARAMDRKLLFLTQPTLWRAGLTDPQERSLLEQTESGAYSATVLGQMMDRYNDVLREVATQTETPLVDLAELLPIDANFFYDDCHFNDAGCDWVAQILADRFEKEFSAGTHPPLAR
jgi:lysophospholipase L1-like esterase